VWGYVVMPEHFHLLIGEPEKKNVSRAMQVLKQRVSRRCRRRKKSADQMMLWESLPPRAFWQRRYYDFNVFRERKHVEKLRYMHRNPVKRGLVESPELWAWSSFRAYWLGEEGPVKIGS
jgi:putative transposase